MTIPAGWYPDPDEGGQNRLRWFDGDWTEHTAPGMTPYEQQMLQIAERDSRRWRNFRRLFWWPLAVAATLAATVFIIGLLITVAANGSTGAEVGVCLVVGSVAALAWVLVWNRRQKRQI